MDRWVGKVAVVTGASSGIGAQLCIDLATAGVIVAGLARRPNRIEELKRSLPSGVTGKIHAVQCDVSNEEDVKRAFGWVEKNLGGVDILVNNAGTIRETSLLDPNNSQPIRDVFNTNVLAVVWCTREAFQSMKNRKTPGHVVLINSIAGHAVPIFAGTGLPSLNVYPSSKFAVTAINEVLRQEFQTEGNKKTKVTSISPGTVLTEIYPTEFVEMIKHGPILLPADISAAVLYVLGTPPHVQIHELTIKPVGEKV